MIVLDESSPRLLQFILMAVYPIAVEIWDSEIVIVNSHSPKMQIPTGDQNQFKKFIETKSVL